MKIKHCKTNHITNPMGYELGTPVLSWITEGTMSQKQVAAQVVVALDKELKEKIFDSGKSADIDNRGVEIDTLLKPCTRYYWQVRVWGQAGDEARSDTYWFETGKMDTPWDAEWITPEWKDQSRAPYVRKAVQLDQDLVSARAYVIGLGLYELEINGKRVGNEYFTPYCNAYDAWLQYQTFDVTDYLNKGDNAIGVLLGNGWAKGPFGTFGDLNTPYIDQFALRCEVIVTYKDGSTSKILTDESWKCQPSPILEDTIYDGEIFDANVMLTDWSQANFDDESWSKMVVYRPQGLGALRERLSVPVIIKEEFKPVELIKTPAGEWVLDMGQNMVGWIRVHVREPQGTKIRICHGEVVQDGNFYRENLRDAKAEYVYISDGVEREVQPHFTFYGFRYAKLEGFTGEIQLEDFTACVVYSDLESRGHIETSDPYVNRLFLNALWGQKGNFLDVPTDCPQRDERMGWTGDAQVFAGTATYNMDTYPFYVKFMRDLYEEQKMSGGMVASTVPTFSQNKQKNSGFVGGGACAWSDAATVIPWEVYLHYGDKTILKNQYQSMKDWVDWIIARDVESGDHKLWTVGFHFGDWLALDGPVEGGVLGGTDNGLLASAYYRLSTNILGKAARVLGYTEDAQYYAERSEQVKQAIQNEYFSKNGRSTILTQTAHVVALHFDLVEESVKQRVLGDLLALLKADNMHLKTGFIGTPYLCRALSNHGDSDSAYKVFFQEDYPSWLYEVVMGATTIWERWNSIMPDGKISGTGMNSLNHYAYGSIVEWMYRNMCGINPTEDAPGFKKIVLRPQFYGKLGFAKGTVRTAMGAVHSEWKRLDNNRVKYTCAIPFDTTAELYLPDADRTRVEGLDADCMNVRQEDTSVVMELLAGHYVFEYTLSRSYDLEYSIASGIKELLSVEATKVIIEKYAPNILKADQGDMGMALPYSILDIVESSEGFIRQTMLGNCNVDQLDEELRKVSVKIREEIR